jgi:hypothetical protein
MSTPYGVSTSIGSIATNGYVNAAVLGPLNSQQYPSVIPYHSYGTLTSIRPTPPQFLPMQEPLNGEMSNNPRQLYHRVFSNNQRNNEVNVRKGLDKYIEQGVIVGGMGNQLFRPSPPTRMYIPSSGRHEAVSTHTNYIPPIPSSMYLNVRKSVAIGKSAYKIGLPIEAPISSKSYYPSGTRSTLQRARSGGCTAPKKKGSIYNEYLRNGAVCGWGALPRQNY